MSKLLTIIGVVLLASVGTASAQTPSPDAMAAARTLVQTLKVSDQYKALLPAILLTIKPLLIQDRPETERDFYSRDGFYEMHFHTDSKSRIKGFTFRNSRFSREVRRMDE